MGHMSSPLQGWRLTAHAREQLAERAVLPSELVACLAAPERRTEGPEDNPGTERWWKGGIGAAVNPATKEVLTILLDGASQATWERVALGRKSNGISAEELLLELEAPRRRRKKPQPEDLAGPVSVRKIGEAASAARVVRPAPRKPQRLPQRPQAPRQQHQAPKKGTSVLDQIDPGLRDIVMAQAGGDVSRIRVITSTKVEIL